MSVPTFDTTFTVDYDMSVAGEEITEIYLYGLDDLSFGIEAVLENNEVQYYFCPAPKLTPYLPPRHPYFVEPNGRIPFGAGPYGKKLGGRPKAKLCNFHRTVVRIMRMSGAAAIFQEERDKQWENSSAVVPMHYREWHPTHKLHQSFAYKTNNIP
ncbi:hypothetical protein DFS33DRAFT_1388663 [Desarmillaria ectypa]|nr:hypothetical protein DFS33DRAFT_1388663 [Desarmillaria ectypa]